MIDMLGIYISTPLYLAGFFLLGASITAGVFIFHVAMVPLIFKYSKTFRRTLIFANFVQWPLNFDYEEPSRTGLEGARNLTVEHHSKVDHCNVKIGIWHILPKSVYEKLKGHFENGTDREALSNILDNELASSKHPIVMYFHGNSNNRATAHRILLYKFFQKMDFHTIAFDYRGYGDSTNLNPSEAGVVEDSLIVYDWLLNISRTNGQNPPIFVWGHSLGTGISSSLLGNLDKLSKEILHKSALPQPNGLVLEAPFSNLADEVAQHPLARMVTWLPYFESTFVTPFKQHTEQRFCSDDNLKRAGGLPVLILHAKDDYIVPFRVGLKLYRSIVKSRQPGDAAVEFHAYEKTENLGHKYICRAADLHQVIGRLLSNISLVWSDKANLDSPATQCAVSSKLVRVGLLSLYRVTPGKLQQTSPTPTPADTPATNLTVAIEETVTEEEIKDNGTGTCNVCPVYSSESYNDELEPYATSSCAASENNSEESGNQSGESGNQSGESENLSGESINQSGVSGNQSVESVNQSGVSGNQSGEGVNPSGVSGNQSGESGNQSGDIVIQSGESGNQSGESGDQSGKNIIKDKLEEIKEKFDKEKIIEKFEDAKEKIKDKLGNFIKKLKKK